MDLTLLYNIITLIIFVSPYGFIESRQVSLANLVEIAAQTVQITS